MNHETSVARQTVGLRGDGFGGFTLIELLVAISVVGVLASITIASISGIMATMKRHQIRQLLATLEGGLENYRQENGVYPVNPGAGDDTAAVEGAVILYRHLSGDFDMDPQGTVDNGKTVYVEGLAHWFKNGYSQPFHGGFAVVDPLGEPVRNLADPPNQDPKATRNPSFDLWSIAGDRKKPPNEAQWVTNW
ncbi:MAG: type II secretion system protein [Akkermansiaceae bacterium]|nr:type II secretion system protein [Akkermansiaceae bacterium]